MAGEARAETAGGQRATPSPAASRPEEPQRAMASSPERGTGTAETASVGERMLRETAAETEKRHSGAISSGASSAEATVP